MYRSILVLAISSLCVTAAQAGDMVKWVDKDGKVHYSDQEPTEKVKSVVHMKKRKQPVQAVAEDKPVTADGDKRPSAPKTPAEEAAAFKERQVKKSEAEAEEKKKREELAMKEKNCIMARNQTKQLEAGGRFTYAGPNGETLFMDDKQIETAKVEARNHEEHWCKG